MKHALYELADALAIRLVLTDTSTGVELKTKGPKYSEHSIQTEGLTWLTDLRVESSVVDEGMEEAAILCHAFGDLLLYADVFKPEDTMYEVRVSLVDAKALGSPVTGVFKGIKTVTQARKAVEPARRKTFVRSAVGSNWEEAA